jgi:hypothetical protein
LPVFIKPSVGRRDHFKEEHAVLFSDETLHAYTL